MRRFCALILAAMLTAALLAGCADGKLATDGFRRGMTVEETEKLLGLTFTDITPVHQSGSVDAEYLRVYAEGVTLPDSDLTAGEMQFIFLYEGLAEGASPAEEDVPGLYAVRAAFPDEEATAAYRAYLTERATASRAPIRRGRRGTSRWPSGATRKTTRRFISCTPRPPGPSTSMYLSRTTAAFSKISTTTGRKTDDPA